MTISNRSAQAFIIGAMLLLAVALLIVLSVDLLPAPPAAATPTWPSGIDLPDKLPRLTR